MTDDAFVPTDEGLFAALELDLVDLIDGLRDSAESDDWGDCEDRPTAEKLRRIAAGLEELRPIDSHAKAKALYDRLKAYGLEPLQR